MDQTRLELFIHVGPHKTATTSIQAALSKNREALLRHGLLYAASPLASGAHHHDPFLLKHWSLERIGLTNHELDFSRYLDAWFDEARNYGAQKILVSAEDFSALSEAEWIDFLSALRHSASINSTEIGRITILMTERQMETRTRSYFQEAIKHGFAHDWHSAASAVVAELSNHDRTLASLTSLASALGLQAHVVKVRFENDPDSSPLLERWFQALVGDALLGELDLIVSPDTMNSRLNSSTEADLLAFNFLNSRDDLTIFRPLNDASAQNDVAWERLGIFASALMSRDQMRYERDEALNQRDEALNQRDEALLENQRIFANLSDLQGSLSWKLTKPLRAVRQSFRLGNR